MIPSEPSIKNTTIHKRAFFRDSALSTIVAGFVATLVGFTSSIVIIFQAAKGLGASPAQISSWIWALGIGMGVCSFFPSLILRQPVMVAWSTSGAAVLATAAASGQFSLAEGIGAFIVSAVLIILFGITGWFERLIDRIPLPLASALLAGILCRFGLDAFGALQSSFTLVVIMLLAYIFSRRLLPRYTMPIVLVVGAVCAGMSGQLHIDQMHWAFAMPVWMPPKFTMAATLSLALPLFIVTMASQNLPGVAVIRESGYDIPISKILTLTGVATLILAPFGGYALNFAAITAAICMGHEAHEDPARRYTAAAYCGIFYAILGLFGAAITGLLAAFPHALVIAVAGFALLGTIGNSLAIALKDEIYREPALITFLVTLSGISLHDIGSAFWGILAGSLALAIQRWRR